MAVHPGRLTRLCVALLSHTRTTQRRRPQVLTHEGLSVIVEAIIIARKIFQRIKSFITYRVAATLQLLLFFFIAVFALPPSDYNSEWPVFFKMPVIMLMLITLLNDGTLISIGYDNVKASPRPEKWNLKVRAVTPFFIFCNALWPLTGDFPYSACLLSLLTCFPLSKESGH